MDASKLVGCRSRSSTSPAERLEKEVLIGHIDMNLFHGRLWWIGAEHVGRRLKLRDLRLLEAVVRWGSIAKAANQLNVTQSAASKAISQLEHAVGVRLLDRNTRGAEPTQYGRALLRRGLTIFDELRQGIKEIEFLADPAIGYVRVGCPEAGAAGLLPAIIQELRRKSPGIVCEAVWMFAMMPLQVRELRERRVDLILVRVNEPEIEDDLCADILFPDPILIVAGHRNKWLRRRRIQLSELINEPWILTPPDSVSSLVVAEAFRSTGLEMPRASVVSTSLQLQQTAEFFLDAGATNLD